MLEFKFDTQLLIEGPSAISVSTRFLLQPRETTPTLYAMPDPPLPDRPLYAAAVCFYHI